MKRLALTTDGRMTWCSAPKGTEGKGRCNHLDHKEDDESIEDFMNRTSNNQSTNIFDGFTLEKKLKMFSDLNKSLKEENLEMDIITSGGFALETYGYRGTSDIDAFYTLDRKVESIIYKIGEDYEIDQSEESWLNNNLMSLNKTPELENTELIIDESNLKVRRVKLDYLLVMKTISGRERDIEDIKTLLRSPELNISGLEDYKKLLESHDLKYDDYRETMLEPIAEVFGWDEVMKDFM